MGVAVDITSMKSWRIGACGLASCLAVGVLAQPVPPVDLRERSELQERQAREREAARRDQLERAPDVLATPAARRVVPWPSDESPCFEIRQIRLRGDTTEVQPRAFDGLLDDLRTGPQAAIGRCLGAQGVNVVAERAQQALIERGYVTSRILLAPQDLSSGTLELTLIPGRIRAIRWAEGTTDRATRANAIPARPGDLLNLRDIEQGLENFKRVPTVQADIQIEPADEPGWSDLVIAWQQTFPFRLSATLDDSGSAATGKYQGSVTVSYDHAFTLNDLLYLTINHDLGGGDTGSRGTNGHTAHYSIPWDDWLLGLTASQNRYHQSVAGLSQDYVYSGDSQNAEVRLSRLVYRDASRKTTLSLKGWMRRSANFIDDTEVRPQRRATGGWAFGLAHKESLGAATLELSLAHRRGTAAFGAMPAPEEAFGEGTSRLRVSTADINLQVPFTLGAQKLRYLGSYRAQWNGTPLAPPDRFAIGGRYTVRGFDGVSSLSAERGWFARNDVVATLGGSGAEAYLALDYGQVRGPSADTLVGKHLAGMALGLRGSVKSLGFDFFVGKPIARPTHFRSASVTAGFSFNASF
jgi:hemolysin activation/secretion protein